MSTVKQFSPDDVNAVIIALAQATHQADQTLVYGLEVVGNIENERDTLMSWGNHFEFHVRNLYGKYIWRNDQLRKENFACGKVTSCQELTSGVVHYRGEVLVSKLY